MDGGGRREAVHIMDGFRRRTIKNIKMWSEVDGWTDGRKSVRGGLTRTTPKYRFLVGSVFEDSVVGSVHFLVNVFSGN